ncbi:Ig-like domain-containing protein, partial [Rubripirellula amarantea]|nr:Ig-like domain-containing protein [Rubripirellula amarantea]
AELWSSDGTSAGTSLFLDIRGGTADSYPNRFAEVSGITFFVADNGIAGRELWKSDGTAAGTSLVLDINPGSSSSNPDYLTNVDGTLYFSANDGTNGYELWRSDGTSAGTTLVADIQSGSSSSVPIQLTNVNGTLYFRAFDSTSGTEIWKSDGTTAGTTLLSDIFAGASGSTPSQLTNVNGTLFFRANNGSDGHELWSSDGTTAGTSQVLDIRPGSSSASPSNFTNVGGTLYFAANDGVNGTELWKSDGSAAGTTLVRDVSAGAGGSIPTRLTNVGGTLFFSASDATGTELWKSDGTSAGTQLVSDIRPGPYSSYPESLINAGGTLFFNANDGTHGYELWSSDGTSAGTALVKDIIPGASSSNPSDLGSVAGELYFRARDNTFGHGLWETNLTTLVTELVPATSIGSPQIDSVFAGSTGLWVVGKTDSFGSELYIGEPSGFSDQDDQISEAIPLVAGTNSGFIQTLPSGATDVDMYSFTANLGDEFDLDVDRPSGGLDSVLRLFDSAGNELDLSDDDVGPAPEYTGTESYLHFVAPTTGTFYIAVTRLGNVDFDAIDGTGDDITSPPRNDPYELIVTVTSLPGLDAVDDSVVTTEDSSVTVSVLDNDLPTGETMIISHDDAVDGSVVDNGDGTLTYTPDNGFTGTDTFDYTIALNDVELINGTASGGDRFGHSVDVDGDFAVVGSYLDDAGGLTNSGTAFVYQRTGFTTWMQVAQLNGDLDAADAQSQFGWSVAIDGDTVVVSAQYDRDIGFRSGAAYVFQKDEGGVDNWGRVKKIVGTDTATRDLFGRSVDISGDTIVVGASVADPIGASSGAVYVFDRDQGGTDNWGQVKKITGSTQAAGDRFGQSVSIDEEFVAVGAFRHDGVGSDSGAAYIFVRNSGGANNWGESKVIEAPDASAADQFGYAVSMSGLSVAIGAPLDDEPGLNQLGSVYLFNFFEGGVNNWGQVAKLSTDDGAQGDRLGLSLAFDGTRIVAGAPQADGGGNESGRAYVFEDVGGTWTQTRVLVNDEVTTADQYGISVGLSGDVAVVGSWLDNRPNNNTGGAYVFDLQTDTATVSVTVAPGSFDLPLTRGTPKLTSISSETVEPSLLVERQRDATAPLVSSASTRDRLFAVGITESTDSELESYLDDIASERLTTKV